jgi:YaiO family outer membrane protein
MKLTKTPVKHIIFIVISALLPYNLLHSQNIKDTTNIEKKFEIAQTYAFEGERDTARILLYQILTKKPDFIDARILIARTHAWDKDYDSARIVYKNILKSKPNNKEALEGIIDVEHWDKKYDAAINYCNTAIKLHPKEKSFKIKKAKILLDKGDLTQAYNELMNVKAIDSANEEVAKLLDDERFILNNDKLSLEYLHEWYDEPYVRRWTLTSFSYLNRQEWGPIIGRIYNGNIRINTGNDTTSVNSSGIQFELEAYPKIDDKHYLYLGVTTSPDYFFPRTRFGAEIYRKLENQAEISFGFRKLNFEGGASPVKEVTVFTGSYNKYFNDIWFSFRAYYTSMLNNANWTYALHGRKYFSSQESYFFAELVFGTSPNEQIFYFSNVEKTSLSSQKFRFGVQKLFSKRWTFFAAYSVENAEYKVNSSHMINAIEFRLGYFLPYSGK